MAYVIAQPCVDVMDRACVAECPVDCIYEGERTLYINPEECVDCRACEPVCPVEAIFPVEQLPPQWAGYAEVNAEFFKQPDRGADHPLVAALPHQNPDRSAVAAFAIRKEDAAIVDVWYPSPGLDG